MALNTTDVLLGCWFKTVLNLLWEQGVGGSNPLTPTRRVTRKPRLNWWGFCLYAIVSNWVNYYQLLPYFHKENFHKVQYFHKVLH